MAPRPFRRGSSRSLSAVPCRALCPFVHDSRPIRVPIPGIGPRHRCHHDGVCSSSSAEPRSCRARFCVTVVERGDVESTPVTRQSRRHPLSLSEVGTAAGRPRLCRLVPLTANHAPYAGPRRRSGPHPAAMITDRDMIHGPCVSRRGGSTGPPLRAAGPVRTGRGRRPRSGRSDWSGTGLWGRTRSAGFACTRQAGVLNRVLALGWAECQQVGAVGLPLPARQGIWRVWGMEPVVAGSSGPAGERLPVACRRGRGRRLDRA
jgi:hypothetical protein